MVTMGIMKEASIVSQLCSPSRLLFGRCSVRSWGVTPTTLTEVFRSFPLSLHLVKICYFVVYFTTLSQTTERQVMTLVINKFERIRKEAVIA